MHDIRAAATRRWAAAGALAAALPVTPLAVAVFGRGSAAPAVIGAGAFGLAGLSAWLGPSAWPGVARALAVERMMVTAVIAWAAALDAAIAGIAVRGGEVVSLDPAAVGATAAVYVAGSAWSVRAPGEVWWRLPVACTVTAAVWVAAQAVAR